ncbi:hypothetical protein AB0M34_33165 [Nocardia sp. NPDC050193]
MTITATDDLFPDIRLGVNLGATYGLFEPAEEFVPQARALGAGIVRVNIYWSQVEPEVGHFVWDAVDALVDQLGDDDEAWVTVVSGSRWATQRVTSWLPGSPAIDTDQYGRFVRALVGRHPGRIRYWQCEIEPCLPMFWSGTALEYLSQLRVLHGAVEQHDPNALVVLGGAVPGAMLGDQAAGAQTWAGFFGEVLRDGSEYFDVFDLHPYGDPYVVDSLVAVSRAQMAAHGYQKPIVASEHSGPLPTDFPEARPHLAEALTVHQQRFLDHGTAALPDSAEEWRVAEDPAVVALYEQMGDLPPTLEMFMNGCPPELEERRNRLARRDMVTRTMLALSSGVRRNLYFPLASDQTLRPDSRYTLVLMFDKLKLMGRTNGALDHRYPAAETFELLAHHLNGALLIERATIPGRPDIYLFEIQRADRAPAMVVWQRPSDWLGIDQAPTEISWHWPYPSTNAVDVTGAPVKITIEQEILHVLVSSTPVFID